MIKKNSELSVPSNREYWDYSSKYHNKNINRDRGYNNTEFKYSNDNFYNNNQNNTSNLKNQEEEIKKPIFINSKLENNGNPMGNFLKLDIITEDKKKFHLVNAGEIPVTDSTTMTLSTIKSLLIGKDKEIEIEKAQNKITPKHSNQNSCSDSLFHNDEKKLISFLAHSKNENNLNGNESWRKGDINFKKEKGNLYGNKNNYFYKGYKNSKKDNYYLNSTGKNFYKNKYSLNQPQSKGLNKFD